MRRYKGAQSEVIEWEDNRRIHYIAASWFPRPSPLGIGKSPSQYCHCPSRRNGIVSYRNDAISPQDWKRAGEFRGRNAPRARWRRWIGRRAVFAKPANPWSDGPVHLSHYRYH
jgi:hypothetical protein